MKVAFTQYLRGKTSIKVILVGTRRNDRHEQVLTHSDVKAHEWPAFMRINLVIE